MFKCCLCGFLACQPRAYNLPVCLVSEVRDATTWLLKLWEIIDCHIQSLLCLRVFICIYRTFFFPGPALRPPLGLREFAPGIPPGRRDMPLDPRQFLPGHPPFRPVGSLGPREYFIPGPRLPPPTHGPQEYPPPPAARDLAPSGSRDEPPPASQSSSQDCSQALKQSP